MANRVGVENDAPNGEGIGLDSFRIPPNETKG